MAARIVALVFVLQQIPALAIEIVFCSIASCTLLYLQAWLVKTCQYNSLSILLRQSHLPPRFNIYHLWSRRRSNLQMWCRFPLCGTIASRFSEHTVTAETFQCLARLSSAYGFVLWCEGHLRSVLGLLQLARVAAPFSQSTYHKCAGRCFLLFVLSFISPLLVRIPVLFEFTGSLLVYSDICLIRAC